MFTGIITGVGCITNVHSLGNSLDNGKRLTIEAPLGYLDDVSLGESIAINGACMTVTAVDLPVRCFSVDISTESLARTSGLDQCGQRINLEKALRANDRLGGHIVSGHVDGIGHVTRFERVGESWELCVMAPLALSKFLAYKGSITVNGVSLTVNRIIDCATGCDFSINLIPHTIDHTALNQLGVGHAVNLEVDTVARYVERMLSASQNGS